ncbi:hypothetical protein [Sphingomonas agri]|uniref:hypothetical protein n=1 Tax=Sphingomonas agri TaxID=1813878 RepID=UPI00311D3559
MSTRSFRSVFMVASCAGAALGCYLVSLRVASERASLEDVETKIVLAQRDMRLLQTEIGTRGRLSQLERWNAGAFALSAPSADQFLKGSFELARLEQPQQKVDFHAPVVLASAPAPAKQPSVGQAETDDSGAPAPATAPAPTGMAARSLLHEASLSTETREVPARRVVALPQATAKPMGALATAAKPVPSRPMKKPDLAAAQHLQKVAEKPLLTTSATRSKAPAKKSVDKLALVTARTMTKPVRLAKVDPLAPLPAKHSGHSKDIAAER